MLADRLTPLDALAGPLAADGEGPLGRTDGAVRDRETPVVEGGQSDFQAAPFLADEIFLRHLHVVEADDRVGQGAQAHEMAAMLDLDPFPIGLDHEGADLASFLAARHDDEQFGQGAVGAPELLAADQVVVAFVGELVGRGHAGRVGADLSLGQGEGGDLAGGAPGEVLLLLLGSAE